MSDLAWFGSNCMFDENAHGIPERIFYKVYFWRRKTRACKITKNANISVKYGSQDKILMKEIKVKFYSVGYEYCHINAHHNDFPIS